MYGFLVFLCMPVISSKLFSLSEEQNMREITDRPK